MVVRRDPELLPDVAKFLDSAHGLWVDGAETMGSGERLDVLNPATGELLARLHSAGSSDVDDAVSAARESFDDGRWSRLPPEARAAAVWKVAELIERDGPDLAQLETLDNGKPIGDSEFIDVPSAASSFRYYAGWATKFGGNTNQVSWPNHLNYTLREPVGVCGVIIPWNFPLIMAARYLAPAISMGNSVVLKPAEETPLTALWLARLCEEAGVPPGVVNVVPGIGEVAGARLAEHPRVDKVSFTGGQVAARSVVAATASNFKRLSLELGGKNPQIVFGGVDLDESLDQVLAGGLYNGGQNCAAGARVYVQRSISDEFQERAIASIGRLQVGPGWHDGVDLGPMISAGHLGRIRGFLDEGVRSGAQVLVGGDCPKGVPEGGFFIEPTVVDGGTDDNVLVREEVFGPVVTVMSFDDEDEIIERANATRFGLTAGLWTRDVSLAHKVARELRVGTVWINGWDRWDSASPFGGVKESGYGHSYGVQALEEFTVLKSVWLDYSS